MSLPGSQKRALGGIEETLLADDLRLGSLFAIFTRLTRHEAMPWTERVEAGPWQRVRPAPGGRHRSDRGHQRAHAQLAGPRPQQSTMTGNTPADSPLEGR